MLSKRSKINKQLRNESGFTLLEILAVIVILGILAVVATPKYFDLQAQARNKSLEASKAEAISRVNGYFAEQVLAGELPIKIAYTDANLGFTPEEFGDEFDVHITSGGAPDTNDDIVITINAAADGPLAGADPITLTLKRPGL